MKHGIWKKDEMDCNKLKVTPIKSYTGTPLCEIYSTIAEKNRKSFIG